VKNLIFFAYMIFGWALPSNWRVGEITYGFTIMFKYTSCGCVSWFCLSLLL